MLRRHCITAALIASLMALACVPARAAYPERPIILIDKGRSVTVA
jgi:hypothetical protein